LPITNPEAISRAANNEVYFIKNGVTIDPDSLKTRDTKINDLAAFDLSFTGKDKDGPADISLTLVQTNAKGKFLVRLLYGNRQTVEVRADDRPFDVIVVHSFSRFLRDAVGLEMYIRRLAKAGVRLMSITQELGDDPPQVMMRQVIALFDEYQSRENAKHVLRAMKENARQGVYNGSRVPLGYAVEDVEQRGHRMKKRLTIDPVEDGHCGVIGPKKRPCRSLKPGAS
jgi:uncharacterized protein YegP (UPF0339 family)